jgi:hypothetical protein
MKKNAFLNALIHIRLFSDGSDCLEKKTECKYFDGDESSQEWSSGR